MEQIKTAILLFNDVEVLDFAGPFEVFSITEVPAADSTRKIKPFDVITIAEQNRIITRNGLKVEPHYVISDSPYFDLVIVPGGKGAEEVELYNTALHEWLHRQQKKGAVIASVCTGAFILAEAGMLQGKKATTHHLDINMLRSRYPDTEVVENKPYIDQGNIVTAGGISSGITMSLYLVERLVSRDTAVATAVRMEYEYK